MKRVLILLVIILLFAACSGEERVVEIEERFFLTQVNHIRRNADDYIGRTVRYEGMFQTFHWPSGDFFMVLRNTRGCCGDDGIVGFEVYLDDIRLFPPENAWVEVVGVLEWYEVDEQQIIRVAVHSLTELDEPGQTVVLQ